MFISPSLADNANFGAVDFPVDISDFPFVTVRRYRLGDDVEHCCPTLSVPALGACLSSSAQILSLGEAVVPDSGLGKDALGVIMMTSARLSASYAIFAEAATARWATSATRSRDIEFVVVEIDDGKENAYGAASTQLSEEVLAQLAGGRAPHWQKVPLIAYMLRRYATVLYVDADASVVHTHTSGWLEDLLDDMATGDYDLAVSREGEGPKELIYSEGGAMRLNDATYVNTGVLLVKDSTWSRGMLRDWWTKAEEAEGAQYLLGRTYDQGALGHLFYTHGTPMRRRPPPPGAPPKTPEQEAEALREQQSNARKAAWRKRVQVVEPEVLNNHAPGGSFVRPQPDADSSKWWCQHFAHPLLQLSGQGNEVRAKVLRGVWLEGACPARDLKERDVVPGDGQLEIDVPGLGEQEFWSSSVQEPTQACRHLLF